jgi:hypothetical protein
VCAGHQPVSCTNTSIIRWTSAVARSRSAAGRAGFSAPASLSVTEMKAAAIRSNAARWRLAKSIISDSWRPACTDAATHAMR